MNNLGVCQAALTPAPEAALPLLCEVKGIASVLKTLQQNGAVVLIGADDILPQDWLSEERILACLDPLLVELTALRVEPLEAGYRALCFPVADQAPINMLHIQSVCSTLETALPNLWLAEETPRLRLAQDADTAPTSLSCLAEDADIVPARLLCIAEDADIAPVPLSPAPRFNVVPITSIPELGSIQDNLTELNELLEIIVTRNLHTQFQPIVSMRDGNVIGYEALIRGPKNAPLRRPGAMFRAAEKARLVAWLDLACLDQCFARAAELGGRKLLFVNMDAEGLAYQQVQEKTLGECARAHGLAPSSIVVEVTERQDVDDFPRLARYIEELRADGFKIAIDDAGAGYSSLHAVAEIRPDFVKIDHSLVRDINVNGSRRALLSALVQYARQIGTSVLAEGAETRAELTTLIALGVEYGQGYLMGKPNDDLRGVPRETRELMQTHSEARARLAVGSDVQVGKLSVPGYRVPSETELSIVVRRMERDTGITSAAVTEGDYLVGLLSRKQVTAAAACHAPNTPVGRLVAHAQIRAVEDEGLSDVAARLTVHQNFELNSDIAVLTRDERYLGAISARALLEAAAAMRGGRVRYTHPLTGLPGRVPLEQQLADRLAKKQPVALIGIDIRDLATFNDVYGVEAGDCLLRGVARCLEAASEHAGTATDFITHLGDDDFAILTDPDRSAALSVELSVEFERLIEEIHSPQHTREGFLEVDPRNGNRRKAAPCTLETAVLSSPARRFLSARQMIESVRENLAGAQRDASRGPNTSSRR